MSSRKKLAITFLTLGMIAAQAPSAAVAATRLQKIPLSYTTGGKTFSNVEGFLVDIDNYEAVRKTVPNHYQENIPCSGIDPSFGSARYGCFNQYQTYTCTQLYQNSIYKPAVRSEQLVPLNNIQSRMNNFTASNPGKKIIAINMGFFDTRAFPNRSTDDNVWKPLFQEACMVNLGTYRSPSNTSGFYGNYNNRETKSDGTPDGPFGTLRFKAAGGTGRSLNGNIDSLIVQGDLGMNGVWLRFNGTDYTASGTTFPAFVKEKAASVVGRTAIGFSTATKKMRILVVQPGRDPARTGLAIEDVRKFFVAADYPEVLLLDGSGSSQLAANFAWQTINGAATSPGRTACLNVETITCSLQGDSVPKQFVANWSAKFKTQDPLVPGNDLVDRRISNALILIADD
jgi:hypothetical protein